MVVLPVVVLLLVFALLTGGSMVLMPLVVVLVLAGAGAFMIGRVLKEGRRPPDRSVRALPTDHLRRQMFLALRPNRRSMRKPDGDKKSE